MSRILVNPDKLKTLLDRIIYLCENCPVRSGCTIKTFTEESTWGYGSEPEDPDECRIRTLFWLRKE